MDTTFQDLNIGDTFVKRYQMTRYIKIRLFEDVGECCRNAVQLSGENKGHFGSFTDHTPVTKVKLEL